MVAGALLALAGTRLAALPLVGAALTAGLAAPHGAPAVQGVSLEAPVVWVALLAAGWVALSPAEPRRLALPLLGALSVLVAGGVPNGAAVLGLWAVSTATALLSAGQAGRRREEWWRWAFGLCAADVLLVAAVGVAALEGFEGWPATLGTAGSVLLLASLTLRVFLGAGPDDGRSEAGLVVVRSQAVVGIVLLSVGAPDGVLRAALMLFAAGFAAAGFLRRRPQMDAAQELCVLGVVLASAALGRVPVDLLWLGLAGGTLIHYLRLISGRDLPGRLAAGLSYGGGIGMPLLPVVMALLEASTSARDEIGLLVVLALVVGLAGRARGADPLPRRTAAGVLPLARGSAVAALAAGVGLWAGAVTLPGWVEPGTVPWPWPWAALAVAAAAVVGSQAPRLVPSRVRARAPARPQAADHASAVADRLANRRALWVGLSAAGLAALAMWALGLARGFL